MEAALKLPNRNSLGYIKSMRGGAGR
jgi:hypothetical protein